MNTPIYNAIKKYHDSEPTPFHMPGHKLGRGLPQEFLQNIALMDLTEIPGTDNLHYPESIIKEAEELAAEAFGADKTFFIVNGSTCGIHAMIMTICKPGDKLIVSRDCHKSVINGLILAGAEPVYVKPEFDEHYGIPTVVTPAVIAQALRENSDAVGVMVTRPNYYGICSDVESIAKIVHSYGKILLVDEAHGAHLKFGKSLPVCAMDGGADICVQSAHKTLTAFTQGAYLHVKSDKINLKRLRFNLRLLQTTSPSYIIMSSLDVARAQMQCKGEELVDDLLRKIDRFIRMVNDSTSLPVEVLEQGTLPRVQLDKTRLVINLRKLGKTGFEIDRLLRQDYNIQVEMSDIFNIVSICTISDDNRSFDKLYDALCDIAIRSEGIPPLNYKYSGYMNIPRREVSLKEVTYLKNINVPLQDAVGRISAGTITPYPPGIPLVCPGEILLRETVEYIYNIVNSNGIINGLEENFEVSIVDVL